MRKILLSLTTCLCLIQETFGGSPSPFSILLGRNLRFARLLPAEWLFDPPAPEALYRRESLPGLLLRKDQGPGRLSATGRQQRRPVQREGQTPRRRLLHRLPQQVYPVRTADRLPATFLRLGGHDEPACQRGLLRFRICR